MWCVCVCACVGACMHVSEREREREIQRERELLWNCVAGIAENDGMSIDIDILRPVSLSF